MGAMLPLLSVTVTLPVRSFPSFLAMESSICPFETARVRMMVIQDFADASTSTV